ncbi:ATP-binding protein [Nocardioides sp. LHD-245]|uniref:sensor histidine kinase n=1 Tax=Nocardioides sp. LHD-245 TaxID=3051387 RepID=UPI0027DF3CE9|nr:ATP-binding protein [Nocardioides sp. LHD-245]
MWWALLLAGLMLHPYAVLLMEDPSIDPMTTAGHICMVLADLVLLGSALVLSFDARLRHSLIRARLATAAILVAVQDLPLLIISVADPTHGGHSYRLTSGHLATVAVVLLVFTVRTRDQHPPRFSPLLGGLLLGCLVLGVRLSLLVLDPSPFLSVRRGPDLAVLAAITVGIVLVTVALMRSSLPRWAAVRVSCGVFALFAARVWATLLEASEPPPLAMVGVVLCSALLATTVIGLLLTTLQDTAVREAKLLLRAAAAEATVQHDREVVHEMRAATAGIVAGVHLLTGDTVPPGPRRTALSHMVDAEVARLGRSFAESPEELDVLCVDDLVGPLVVAQDALGHPVAWQPGGHRVVGRHDALTEVLNVLLNNAHRHARGHATAVVSRSVGEVVELRVSDRGPGIEPGLEDRLFQWGARGSASTGQGIGLQRAHRLMLELGGSLRLERTEAATAGTTFVVTLHSADAGAVRTTPPPASASPPPPAGPPVVSPAVTAGARG